MSNVVSINDRRSKLWEDYVTAQRVAQQTCRIEDGIEAGHAWKRWLNVYMTPEQRQYIDGDREGMIR